MTERDSNGQVIVPKVSANDYDKNMMELKADRYIKDFDVDTLDYPVNVGNEGVTIIIDKEIYLVIAEDEYGSYCKKVGKEIYNA